METDGIVASVLSRLTNRCCEPCMASSLHDGSCEVGVILRPQDAATPMAACSMGPLTSSCLAKAFPTVDRGLQFARRAAGRVSVGPLDRIDSDDSDTVASNADDADGEDEESFSPLLRARKQKAASTKSRSPLFKHREGIRAASPFAQEMLHVCKHVAREARNDGPNLYESESSASPIKRRSSWKDGAGPPSPAKRRTVGAPASPARHQADGKSAVTYLWEPVFASRVSVAALQQRGRLAIEKEINCAVKDSCSVDGARHEERENCKATTCDDLYRACQ